jgi:tetratricopeptide (TPR) repeat protein
MQRVWRRATRVALIGTLTMTVGFALLPARAHAEDPAEGARLAYRAAQAAPDRDQSRREYQRGIALARAALTRDPNDPAGLLWLAANLGGEALTHGKLHALGVVGEVERTLLRLDQVNPDYAHAAAARALGRLYQKAPSIISVGNNKKAADYLQRALARAPDFPGNWAYTADFLSEQGDCTRALPLAQRLRAAPDLDRYGADAREWRDLAARVLAHCR